MGINFEGNKKEITFDMERKNRTEKDKEIRKKTNKITNHEIREVYVCVCGTVTVEIKTASH